MSVLDSQFRQMKNFDVSSSNVSFYIVSRSMNQRIAYYKVKCVRIDDELETRLRGIIRKKIEDANTIKEYQYLETEVSEDIHGIPINDSDVGRILNKLMSSDSIEEVSDPNELIDTWMYVIRLDMRGETLFAYRKISSLWKIKKVMPGITLVWKNKGLVGLEYEKVFGLDNNIDFISFNDYTFVIDRTNFESATNFRLGMEKKRDDVINEFKDLGIVDDHDRLRDWVGNNVRLLKKLAEVGNSGFFRDPNYMRKVSEVSDKNGWGIVLNSSGAIVVEEGKEELILTVLNNARLLSELTDSEYDVEIKKPVNTTT